MIFKGHNEYYFQKEDRIISAGECPPFSYAPIILEGKGSIFQVADKWEAEDITTYELVRLADYLRVIYTEQSLLCNFTKVVNKNSIERIRQEVNSLVEKNDQTILQVTDA